jgi:hypothetical protein
MEPSKRKRGRNSVSLVVPYPLRDCEARLIDQLNGPKRTLGLRFKLDAQSTSVFEIFDMSPGSNGNSISAHGILEPLDDQQTRITFTTNAGVGPLMLGILGVMAGLWAFGGWYGDKVNMICCPLWLGLSTFIAVGIRNTNLEISYKLKQHIISVFDIEPGVGDMRLSRRRNIGAIVIVFAAFMLQWGIALTYTPLGWLLPIVWGAVLTVILLELDHRI